jgi:hypothetical protein
VVEWLVIVGREDAVPARLPDGRVLEAELLKILGPLQVGKA